MDCPALLANGFVPVDAVAVPKLRFRRRSWDLIFAAEAWVSARGPCKRRCCCRALGGDITRDLVGDCSRAAARGDLFAAEAPGSLAATAALQRVKGHTSGSARRRKSGCEGGVARQERTGEW